ncbi:dipeptide ABC transporter ATP-binding protein [Halorussus salinisoli]|uniref:dipeptide ABC transporter ATP-binding protein n=1 Tax=Halorussus salinisoli TaxID=2558242 RepID=UPI0010C21AE7|nr:ABC transporter ATP-binding protein [Halorussus salinisoli]
MSSTKTDDDADSSTSVATKPLLEIESLSVSYSTKDGDVQALRDIDLRIDPGQTVGVAGESGSGKSTLALAILQYLGENGQIVNGSVRFKDHDLQDSSPKELKQLRGNHIAHVPQDPKTALNPSLTVGEQVRETIEVHRNVTKKEATDRVLELFQQVEIADSEHVLGKYPHELSGGQQQRVLLAMALSCDPELLILDEPTTGLDVTTQAKILDLIKDLEESRDSSTLLITHDISVLAQTSDDLVILYAGEIMERGRVTDVLKDPAHPYTQGLLAALPRIGEEQDLSAMPGRVPDLDRIPTGCIFADRCEFDEEACREAPIEEEDVPGETDHRSRCRRIETVLSDRLTERSATATRSGRQVSSAAETERETLVEASEVQKYFGSASFFDRWFESNPPVKAVDGVDLSIKEGETLGLVGESGSGKSTLGELLLRLLAVDDGTITYRDHDITSLDGNDIADFRSNTGVVFQNPHASLNPQKTVVEILERPLKQFTDMDAEGRRQRVAELLGQVNLDTSYVGRYPHELSGGEKQRVAIARAFASNPSFVVLDEPVSALDVSIQANILDLLSELQAEYGSSYLFISHDLSVVKHISDRIAVMYLGHVMEVGPTGAVFEPPYHPYTRALLSSVPLADPEEKREPIHLSGDVPNARDPPSGCPFHTRCPQYIGDVCEEEYPTLESKSGDETHRIACHHDPSSLMTPIERTTDGTGDASDE